MKQIVALFALCFFVFIAPAQAADNILDIKEVTSPGGIKAWLVEDHSVPVIAMSFSFKGMGAAQDPADKQGLARMASNTMDEGAGDLTSEAFQKELRDLVISLYFNTGRDDFGGTLKTLTKNKVRAFELLNLALTKPRFDDDPVERMRNGNQSRIRSSLADPGWNAARIMNDVSFAGHPYAQNSGGTLTTLENITADDLRTFAGKLALNQLHVSVAGDITEDELKTVLDDVFGDLPKDITPSEVADLSLTNPGKIYIYNKDIPQTVIEITQPGIDRHDEDYHTAQIMNFILGSSGFGSRLTKEIREKRGLTYGIYSYFTDMDHTETLSVSTSTKNENVPEMLSLIKAEFNKMAAAPITDNELDSAKSYLIGSLPLSLTSTDKIAGLMLSLQLADLPPNYPKLREEKIKATTVKDVQRVAKRLLDPAAFTTVLVGQPGAIENAEIIEALPNAE